MASLAYASARAALGDSDALPPLHQPGYGFAVGDDAPAAPTGSLDYAVDHVEDL
ncbi:MAG: hypothetical protein AB7T37_08620 [Dehalococcoidia bacterium]